MTEKIEALTMANYDAYLLVMVLPPVILTVTILLVSYVAWAVSYLQYKRQKTRVEENRGENELIEYPGLQYMYLVLQPVLGRGLEARRTGQKVKIKLHGEKISPGVVPLLVQSLALAVGLSLAVFVTVLLVEDGGEVCSERLDCFPFNYSRQVTPLTREPIRNCSTYRSSDISIRCFSFSVRFVEAVGSSGGVLILATLGLNLYLALLFALAKVGCCRRTGLCGLLLLLIFGCLVLTSTLIWIIPLGLVQTQTLKYVHNWESVLVYFYTFVYLCISSTLLLYCVPSYRRDFQRCCSGEGWQRGYLPPHGMDTDEEDEEEEERRSRGRRRKRQRSNNYQTTEGRSGSQARRAGYYGSVDKRRPSEDQNTSSSSVVGEEDGEEEGEVGSGGIEIELSSEDSGEERSGGGSHQKWRGGGGGGGGQSGTAKVRAVLTGDVVENGGKRRSASVHTHL